MRSACGEIRTPSQNVLAPLLPQRHRTLAQRRLRHGGLIKDQMIMLCSSMRDSRAEWFHTFASVRTMGFRPTAPPA
jgi:hypothetical protein